MLFGTLQDVFEKTGGCFLPSLSYLFLLPSLSLEHSYDDCSHHIESGEQGRHSKGVRKVTWKVLGSMRTSWPGASMLSFVLPASGLSHTTERRFCFV